MAFSASRTYGFDLIPLSSTQVRISGGQVLYAGLWRQCPADTLIDLEIGTNYIEADSQGNVVKNTTSFTDGNSYLYAITRTSAGLTSVQDWTKGPGLAPSGGGAPSGALLDEDGAALLDENGSALLEE